MGSDRERRYESKDTGLPSVLVVYPNPLFPLLSFYTHIGISNETIHYQSSSHSFKYTIRYSLTFDTIEMN